MSTKTTFKRIALVTVAALGFGTMAAVPPASAAASVLTTVKVSDATVYGYVGETLTAAVKVTQTGVAAGALYTTDDSITLTAKITSIASANLPAVTTTGAAQSVESVASDSATINTQLNVNQFRFIESETAALSGFLPALGVTRVSLDDTTTVPMTVATLAFRPSTPGTYKITVTPSNIQAGVSPTYTAGVITFVVLSAGAATGDGGVATPFATAGGVAGAGNYNQVKVTGQLGATALGTRVVVTGGTIDAAITGSTLSTDKTVLTIAGVTTGTPTQGNINVLTPTAGSIVVSTFRETAVGTYSTTADSTVTITVRATGQSQVYSYNETYMATGNATPTATTDAAAVATVPTAAAEVVASPAPVATIQVDQYDVLTAALGATKTKAITVEITGAGRVSQSATAVGSSTTVVVAAASANSQVFYVHPDGRSGTGTVVVKVDGVEALKRTVSFTGVASQLKLVAATAAAPNPSKSYLAVGGTMTISVLPYDANNIKMSAVSVTATSETATVATVLSTSYAGGVVTVTGVATGKTNITIKNGTLGTLVVPVEVTKSTGKAVLTLDKTSAQPGEKVTWTITATDTNGRPTADGTYAFFSSVTANMSVTGLPTGTETITGGVSTGSFFAPVSGSGTLTITAKHGTAHDTYIAGLKASSSYTAVSDVVELAIVNSAVDAATAAAEAAEAAAQDATDAALDATTAAEAAGALAQEAVDAVAELAANVTKLFTELNAQIAKLTTLILKVGTSVAKIAAKK